LSGALIRLLGFFGMVERGEDVADVVVNQRVFVIEFEGLDLFLKGGGGVALL